ncbi:MAG: hypothetical protein JW791_00525 [Nanoarchaeota archaeon]|nr:hypothetical protein [Nanoarchaeota archaeon]
MLKKLFLLLFLMPAAYCGVEAAVFNHYLYPGSNLEFSIDISEDYTGTADLKFCLAEFNFDELSYNYRCDIFLERHDITFDKTYYKIYSIPLNEVQPLIYRLFVQLHFEDKYHKDSDSDNFIYLASPKEPTVFVYNPKGVIILPNNLAHTAEQDEAITADFNITTYENCTNYQVYSYVYNNTKCITGSFNNNLRRVELPFGSSMRLYLKNTIDWNATIGDYDYKIRVNACGKDYDYSQPITITEKRKPLYNITINHDLILIKNYDNTNLTYNIIIIEEEENNTIIGELKPHNQIIIELDNSSKFVKAIINNAVEHNQLFLEQDKQSIIEESSKITGEIIMVESEGEEKPFYILSILTSLGALAIIYKGLR